MNGDQLHLRLPADPAYVRVARAAAVGLGERLGMPWRDIEDLALAVDETLVLLLRPGGTSGEVAITFTVADDALGVRTRLTAGQDPPAPGALERFLALVAPMVDAHEVGAGATEVVIQKRRALR